MPVEYDFFHMFVIVLVVECEKKIGDRVWHLPKEAKNLSKTPCTTRENSLCFVNRMTDSSSKIGNAFKKEKWRFQKINLSEKSEKCAP